MSSLITEPGLKGGKITTWSWDDTIFCNISLLAGLIPNPTITIPSSFTCCEEFNARSGSSVMGKQKHQQMMGMYRIALTL